MDRSGHVCQVWVDSVGRRWVGEQKHRANIRIGVAPGFGENDRAFSSQLNRGRFLVNSVNITFGLYFVVLLALGIIAWQRTHNLSDYILGGRTPGSGVTALSAGVSDMSGWLLLDLPGATYRGGLAAGWIALGLLIGTWLNWLGVARRLRRATEKLDDSLTLLDYFQRCFADHSRFSRVIPSVFIFVFFALYVNSGLMAGGKLFEEVFSLPYLWAMAANVLAIIVYTFLGGWR